MTGRNLLSQASKQELDEAKAKGQVLGWVQAVGAMMVLGLVVKFLGLIPVLIVGGAVAYLGYKVLFGGKKS